MEKHIPGLLRACRDGACTCGYLTSADRDVFVAKAIGKGDHVDPYPNSEQQQANMNRLASAWNACDGIPTEHLHPGAVKALVEAVTTLVKELHDSGLNEAREVWGNTNVNVIQRKRDAVRAALATLDAPAEGGTTHDGESR